MEHRTSETSHRQSTLSPTRFKTQFVPDVTSATVVRIVHAFQGPDPKDRNRYAKAVIANVLKSWRRSLKTRYLITTGGFLSFEWPRQVAVADPGKPSATDIRRLKKAARDACSNFLSPRLRRKLAKVADYISLGADSDDGNESYDDFARKLQTEYEDDCGVTFGKVPIQAFIKMAQVVDGKEQPVGKEAAGVIWNTLVANGMLAADGKIEPKFDPKKDGFTLNLPEPHKALESQIIDVLSNYQLERHIRDNRKEGLNNLKKAVQLSPGFESLWGRIKPRTTYQVEFTTDDLVHRAVQALRKMPKVEAAKVNFTTAELSVTNAGVEARAVAAKTETVLYRGSLPDILAYLQSETELTRSTLVRILKESGRLSEFFINPQRFMDSVAAIMKSELHQLIVDGIKYQRIPASDPEFEWRQELFKNEELINYLTALQVDHSIYEYIVYDSQVEREFAQKLDAREDIKLFVKLPRWFQVETPIGKYNPDWAILKHNEETLYLVRETKSTKDFLKLRTTEADKVRCGQKHFEAIGTSFAVVISADEV